MLILPVNITLFSCGSDKDFVNLRKSTPELLSLHYLKSVLSELECGNLLKFNFKYQLRYYCITVFAFCVFCSQM